MTPVDFWSADKIPLKDYINMNDVHKIVDRGAIVAIYPEKGRLQAVCIFKYFIFYCRSGIENFSTSEDH